MTGKISRASTTIAKLLSVIVMLNMTGHLLSQTAKPSFSISLSARHTEFQTGAPLQIEIDTKNESDELLFLGNSGTAGEGIIVKDSSGTILPSIYANKIPFRLSGMGFGIVPDKTHIEFVYLNKLFDLKKPGNYTVQFQRMDRQTHQLISSNILEISITP